MSEISATAIGTLRYAPEGAATIRAYNYNGVEGLTLAQLIMAFSFRRAAQTEQTCVNMMNQLSLGADRLTTLSDAAQFVLANGQKQFGRWGKWSDVRAFLVKVGVDEKNLPQVIDRNTSHKEIMAVYELIRTKLTECNASNDTLAVELQTSVNRRDVVYNTATSSIAGLGQSAIACAMKLK